MSSSGRTASAERLNKLLVSACLRGTPVRHQSRAKPLQHDGRAAPDQWQRGIGYFPEVAGGLAVPRAAAEIIAGDGAAVIAGTATVETGDGTGVTGYILAGAGLALALCRHHLIRVAVLAESNPSAGSNSIYDGSFRRNAIPGSGVTAALLLQHGIRVFNQRQLCQAVIQLATRGGKR